MKLVVICGASGAGKTTLAKRLMRNYAGVSELLSIDDYYYPFLGESHNFDTPESIEWSFLERQINNILDGQCCQIPRYDFVSKARSFGRLIECPPDLLIVEGVFSFHSERLFELADLTVYCDCNIELAVKRRMSRDSFDDTRLGQSENKQQIDNMVSGYLEYVLPKREMADIVLSTESDVQTQEVILEILL